MSVKPRCRFNCRFLQITDHVWLCPHGAWGEAVDHNLAGIVEEARRLLDRAGGYDLVLLRVETEEREQREKRARKRTRVRYDVKAPG